MEGIETCQPDAELVAFAATANRVTVDHLQNEMAKLARALDVANGEIARLRVENECRKRLRSSKADDHELERQIWATQHADDVKWVETKTEEFVAREAADHRRIVQLESALKLAKAARRRWASKLRGVVEAMEEK